jgi:hypothetical protein
VLQRQAPRRPRLGPADRFLWVLLSRLWPNWRPALQIVTPDTVVRWHRRGFALFWGRTAYPRRVAGARPHGLIDHGGKVSRPARRSAVSDVAHIPHQSRLPARLGRLLHGPHGHLSRVVRVRGAVAPPTSHRPRERHGAPDRGVDRATAPRGVAVGHRPAIRHTGSRHDLWIGSSACRAVDGQARGTLWFYPALAKPRAGGSRFGYEATVAVRVYVNDSTGGLEREDGQATWRKKAESNPQDTMLRQFVIHTGCGSSPESANTARSEISGRVLASVTARHRKPFPRGRSFWQGQPPTTAL